MRSLVFLAGVSCLGGAAVGDIDYTAQAREYGAYAYLDPHGDWNGVAPDFGPYNVFARSEGVGAHGEVAVAEVTHSSSLLADRILYSTDVGVRADFIGGGLGFASAGASLDVTFTLATAQAFRFTAVTESAFVGPNYSWTGRASLEGAGGVVFEILPMFNATQSFEGVLAAGTYRYRVQLGHGVGPSGLSTASLDADLVIPAPSGMAAFFGGILLATHRRRAKSVRS